MAVESSFKREKNEACLMMGTYTALCCLFSITDVAIDYADRFLGVT